MPRTGGTRLPAAFAGPWGRLVTAGSQVSGALVVPPFPLFPPSVPPAPQIQRCGRHVCLARYVPTWCLESSLVPPLSSCLHPTPPPAAAFKLVIGSCLIAPPPTPRSWLWRASPKLREVASAAVVAVAGAGGGR